MTQLASSPVSMRPARRLPGQFRLSVPMDRRVPGSELPYYEDIPYDSDWHRYATYLLTDIMDYYRKDRHDLYAAARMFVYFDPDQVKTHNFRGPDFFVVKGVKDDGPRKSWVIWEEDCLTPDFVIELASSSTDRFDRKEKKDIYEQTLKTPEYVIYNPETEELSAWRLSGGRYTPIKADARGWVWSNELGLWLGVVEHDFPKFRA
ncbi:MAG: Uma2 family endonuclease, partial [Gammaproteobacteria bacterium]|nr:Uma2 family endonuclease [Gammaproteobacteria bacterium]